MVDIRPQDLNPAVTPIDADSPIIIDQGGDGVNRTTSTEMVNSVAPVASQSEAEVGADDVKRMTALKTKQSISSEVGVSVASYAAGQAGLSAVQSVNGKTGNSVTLVKGDVGLGNVDDTSDVDKPVSTAQQAALDGKATTAQGALADTALQAPGGSAGQILAKNSAADNDVIWVSSEAATAVSYGPQTLTPAQQAQARQNIQSDKSYDSVAIVASSNVPSFANAIRTNGYAVPGDGGGALYKRIPSASDSVTGTFIISGNFSNATKWDAGSAWVVEGGRAKCNGAMHSRIEQFCPLEEGKIYEVSFQVLNYVQGGAIFRALNSVPSTVSQGEVRSGNGTYTERFTAGAGIVTLSLAAAGSGTNTFDVDNFSVKEVVPAETITDASGQIFELAEEVLKVEHFGALADGVTDNTAAVQRALDVAVAFNKPLKFSRGTYLMGQVVLKGRISISGAGRGSITNHEMADTVLKFSKTDGDMWTVRHGANIANSEFRDMLLMGRGQDVAGDATGFHIPHTGYNNRSIIFHNMGARDFSNYGFLIADSIGLMFTGSTLLDHCGSIINTKGAGIHLYWGGWLSVDTAALCAFIQDVNAYWCYRGISTPDKDALHNSSIGGQFQRCDVGVRAMNSRALVLNRIYTEHNVTAGAQVQHATIISPQLRTQGSGIPQPENDIYCSGSKVMLSETYGSMASFVSGELSVRELGRTNQSSNSSIFSGSESPEGAIEAAAGSIYMRRTTSGGIPRLYLKITSASVNTGWKSILFSASGSVRPSLTGNENIGYMHFDTGINKPIWWTGTKWVDADGVDVV